MVLIECRIYLAQDQYTGGQPSLLAFFIFFPTREFCVYFLKPILLRGLRLSFHHYDLGEGSRFCKRINNSESPVRNYVLFVMLRLSQDFETLRCGE